jgi:anti-sigma factor RsiW
MRPENLEFQIAQYADGTLSATEASALERILETDAEARSMLEAYQATDAALKGLGGDLPAMKWDELAGAISASVARIPETRSTGGVPEGLEFSIAQYADGTLKDDRRSSVEARLSRDPAARLVLRDYEAVDAAARRLHREIDPPPVVAWDRFAQMIAGAIAAQTSERIEEEAEFELAQALIRLRRPARRV